MGQTLTRILEQVAASASDAATTGGALDLGARTLPQIPRHVGDRNRTSPFAFTGNKFEFRAVGASQAVAWPNTVLNVIVADSIRHIADAIERELGDEASDPAKVRQAIRPLLAREIEQHKRVIFNGDNYSQEWVDEAKKRGLPNIPTCVEALPALGEGETVELFSSLGVLNEAELASRVNIYLERWSKQTLIEADTMLQMARTMILPAAQRWRREMAESIAATEALEAPCEACRAGIEGLCNTIEALARAVQSLADAREAACDEEPLAQAQRIMRTIRPAMQDVRDAADALETMLPADLWPMPTYRDLLFR
ncbi:MAG: hypothetical protein D6824_09165 [Planctomycetota bacterium]|nr:MAG: hypothetical protein D6824_09165 [Planctomycetota bacterium]